MLRPGLWIIVGLLLAAFGITLSTSGLWLAGGLPVWHDMSRTWDAISYIGLLAFVGGLVLAAIAGLVLAKRNALRAGTGLLARWRVGMLDWAAFRRRDAARDGLFHSLRNRLRLPEELPPEGMEIRVGADAMLVGDACYGLGYFASRGTLVDIARVEGEPEMLEFLTHQQGKNSSRLVVFRIPVPAAAREDAQKLVDHFSRTIDARRRERVRTHFAPHFQAASGDAGEAEAARAEDRRRNWQRTGFGLLVSGGLMLGVGIWIAQGRVTNPGGLHILLASGGALAAIGLLCLFVAALRRD